MALQPEHFRTSEPAPAGFFSFYLSKNPMLVQHPDYPGASYQLVNSVQGWILQKAKAPSPGQMSLFDAGDLHVGDRLTRMKF